MTLAWYLTIVFVTGFIASQATCYWITWKWNRECLKNIDLRFAIRNIITTTDGWNIPEDSTAWKAIDAARQLITKEQSDG